MSTNSSKQRSSRSYLHKYKYSYPGAIKGVRGFTSGCIPYGIQPGVNPHTPLIPYGSQHGVNLRTALIAPGWRIYFLC